jgi:hypothetical protein
MRTGVTVYLGSTDRKRLQAIVDDRNSPQKHVWRARIVLATADGLGTATIMRTVGVSKTAVWRWQERFMSEGVDGLLSDSASSAASSKASSISRPPSIDSSPTTTSGQSPSSGPPIQTKSSPPPIVGIKCWIQSTRACPIRVESGGFPKVGG